MAIEKSIKTLLLVARKAEKKYICFINDYNNLYYETHLIRNVQKLMRAINFV